MDADPRLARLLEHPAIWRGRSAARRCGTPTGFDALDACLPDRGWPRAGLIEILVSRFGSGEMRVLLPALAALTRARCARWCVWVAPPLIPFAPALAEGGIRLDRVAVVGAAQPGWAFEQALGSGACDVVLAWMRRARTQELRRVQLAAERGRTLGVLFRPRHAARDASVAVLRLGLEPLAAGVRIALLKGRTARRDVLELSWPTTATS